MIKFILVFVGFLLAFGWFYSVYATPKIMKIYVCKNCGAKSNVVELVKDKCPMCGGELTDDLPEKRKIVDFDYQFQTPTIKHKKGCGCRLCYVNPTDFRDLKEYNWWDFHDTSGQRVYANGTLPLFGLWTNKDNLRAPHCLQAKFDWRFNSPCTDPHKVIDGIHKSPDFPFPAECDNNGRCRIRGPLLDNIKNL